MNLVNTAPRNYIGEVIPVTRECELNVEYYGFIGCLPAAVNKGDGPYLMGTNLLQHIGVRSFTKLL